MRKIFHSGLVLRRAGYYILPANMVYEIPFGNDKRLGEQPAFTATSAIIAFPVQYGSKTDDCSIH